MTERFRKTYDVLYNAFMNETLAKGTCTACAVGNIVADAMGGKINIRNHNFVCDVHNTWWSMFFITFDNKQHINDDYSDNPNYTILKELTGYSVQELAKIEFAFETNTKISFNEYFSSTEEQILEDQFNGLMAVMDVMIELDDIKDGENFKETFKNKFAYEHR